MTSTGSATSIFGYAGEQFDTTGLIYLRARYLQPTLGIFLSRDPWSGDDLRPGSMNGFNYVEGNPVNFTDASGQWVPWPVILCMSPNHWEEVYEWSEGRRQWVGWRCVGPGGSSGLPPVFGLADTTTIGGDPYSTALRILLVYGAYCVGQAATQPRVQVLPRIGPIAVPTVEPFPMPRDLPYPTPTEQPKRQHIALGVQDNQYLFKFWRGLNQKLNPENIYVYTYDTWGDMGVGLSDVPASMRLGTFGLAFDQATTRAERIHFNLEGIRGDPNVFAEKLGGQGQFNARNIKTTAVELYRVKHRPELCAKTDFYESGSTNQIPSLPWKIAICQ